MFREKRTFLLLAFILLVAGLLRFWNYFALTFTFDELNAMERTVFSGFGDLIRMGVKVDSHPSLIQVLLWAWQKLFGDSEVAIKFPFVIMGIVSVYLGFSVATTFFNQTVGFMVAAFLSALAFTVMYSQLARPYISGMCFGLALVNALLGFSHENKFRHLFFIFLFAELCLYNHHFSGCFAVFACLGAFTFIPKARYKNFIACGCAIVIGYLPEAPITLYQLNVVSYMGGLAGIASPGNNYLLKFFECVLNYSRLMYGLAFLCIAASLFYMLRKRTPGAHGYRLYCLLLFLLPYLIGFLYSKNVSQVLQHSTLIFGLPFLLMAVLSGFPELSFQKNTTLVACILAPCIYTLVVTRDHYHYFYRQPFDSMYSQTLRLQDSLKHERISVYMNSEPYVHYYYHKKYGRNIVLLPRKEQMDIAAFRSTLDTLRSEYVILANPYDEYVNLTREKYPYLIHRQFSYSLNFYCYSKKPEHAGLREVFPYESNFSKNGKWQSGDWQTGPDPLTGKPTVTYIPGDEYGLVFADTLSNISKNYSDKLNFAFDLETEGKDEPMIGFEAVENGVKTLWDGYDLANYHLPAGRKGAVYYSVNMEYLLATIHPDALIKFYVWNHKKSRFRLSRIRLFTTPFNKNLFKMFEPLNQ